MARRIILKEITELSMCEVFVFGSNLEGKHYGGAARTAYEKFGAEWGVGTGPTGKSYAIPTMHGGVKDIKPYVDEFIEYARNHPNNRFLLTRIGCGIAGFKDRQIAPLFKEAWKLPNVNFPKEWYPIVTSDEFIDAVMFGVLPKEQTFKIPKAITERDLSRLCQQYKYIIGSGVKAPLPKIRVRYVLDNGRFGYADFGDFFIDELGMYVWTRNKEFAESHNQDLVEVFFKDECKGRGLFHRVLFAGVETPYHDMKGDSIFTGDVIDVENSGMKLALGTLGENLDEHPDYQARYAFVLDNHFLAPEDCRRMIRIGTVFYQLDWGDDITVAQRCWSFQGCYPGAMSTQEKLVLAKYTPNFDKEKWKYHALEILGAEEFNWRK